MSGDYGVMTFIYMGDGEAYVSVQGEDGELHEVTMLKSGESTRQYSPVGTAWVVETLRERKPVTGSSSPTFRPASNLEMQEVEPETGAVTGSSSPTELSDG